MLQEETVRRRFKHFATIYFMDIIIIIIIIIINSIILGELFPSVLPVSCEPLFSLSLRAVSDQQRAGKSCADVTSEKRAVFFFLCVTLPLSPQV
jgi:hypothetical protein